MLDIMLIKVSPSQTLCVEDCNNGVKFGERCPEGQLYARSAQDCVGSL